MTTAAGFWLGMTHMDQLALMIPTLIGTALVVGGANTLNQWAERREDALMQRTKNRPLPAGRLVPLSALRFGILISLFGVLILALISIMASLVAIVSWISYVLWYTPLKRVTPLCTLVGAIPGALPPVIGWIAVRSELSIGAYVLFGVLFVWQLPHFLALSILYREDYEKAGFRMLPLMDAGSLISARQMMLYGAVLLPISLVPTLIGLTGSWYFFCALILGIIFLILTFHAAWNRSLMAARQLFLASVTYLPLLLIALVLDKQSIG